MNVNEMQRKLSLWAEQDQEHQFNDLYNLLTRPQWLRLAYEGVRHNAGKYTAGCDGITTKDFDRDVEGNLERLREALKSRTFSPYPVRRVYIPKSDGKVRPLGIPSVRDRIVQEALRMLLEPIFEADFSQYSYGFRPTRSTMDAVKAAYTVTQETVKCFWVVEGDISAYFDTVKHKKLMKFLRRRIKDKRVLDLIWQFLKAGVMEGKLFSATDEGVPQGGIISPLLANVYLHEFDVYMRQRYGSFTSWQRRKRRNEGLGNVFYVRYADDFLVLTNGPKRQALALREEFHDFLATSLRLDLSLEKTVVTHLNDGFEFLGFKVQRKMGGKGIATKIEIPKAALDRVKARIAYLTSPDTHKDSVATKILALNRVIGGWCRYYQYTGHASTTFAQLEYYIFWRVAHWLGRKYQISMPKVMRKYLKDKTLIVDDNRLLKARDFKTKVYKKRFIKPNPYTLQREVAQLERESLTNFEVYWTGYEYERRGAGDLRLNVLRRDCFTCQSCGTKVSEQDAHVDHIKPIASFKDASNAHRLSNLQTLCIACHKDKSKSDRRVESRVQ